MNDAARRPFIGIAHHKKRKSQMNRLALPQGGNFKIKV